MLDLALEWGLAVVVSSPLAGGKLAGAGTDARSTAVIAALDALATRHAVNRTAITFTLMMAHPARPIPIVGSQTETHIAESTPALG